jgi:hypothetical protein
MDNASGASSEVRPAGEEHPPLPADLYCPECGYNLRGLTSRRCPECGLSLEHIEALGTQIAWVHRRAIGTFRSYWRTARDTTFRGRRFLRGIPPFVEYKHAQRFRYVTIMTLSITALCVYGSYCIANSDVRQDLVLNGWYRAVQFLAGVLALAALSGLPSYLFHPRHLSPEQQNRAIAMSYYACAPLAFVAWTLPMYALGVLLAMADGWAYDSPPWLALTVTASAFILWWLHLVRLGRTLLHRRWARIRVALLVPVLWLVVGVVIVGGLPWLVLYGVTLVAALS